MFSKYGRPTVFLILLILSALACKSIMPDTATPLPPATPKQSNTPQAKSEESTSQPTGQPRPDLLFNTHSREGSVEIYGMQADGSNIVRLTETDYASNWRPAWSPDCNRIAFESDRLDGSEFLIYVMEYVDKQSARLLLDPKQFLSGKMASWSPDGKKIAFSGRLHDEIGKAIFMMNTDGSQVERLTNHARSGALDTCPAWSPDGQYIAFMRTPDGRVDHLMVMNASGGGERILATSRNIAYGCPSWSPDSQRIVFLHNSGNPGEVEDLAIINLDGSGFVNLTNTPNIEEWEPDWSPDGQRIAYMTRSGGSGLQIRSINIDGTDDIALTDDEVNYHYPDWCPLP
jgi:Tol biopolymer transport system component